MLLHSLLRYCTRSTVDCGADEDGERGQQQPSLTGLGGWDGWGSSSLVWSITQPRGEAREPSSKQATAHHGEGRQVGPNRWHLGRLRASPSASPPLCPPSPLLLVVAVGGPASALRLRLPHAHTPPWSVVSSPTSLVFLMPTTTTTTTTTRRVSVWCVGAGSRNGALWRDWSRRSSPP